ncbi:MAG: RecX family transcriptional regulator [Sediminibacterium sp. Gen4]|jgi:regulatory protein|uniref:regulatory protein RecX n=1 Tax=unclassified Sediminibacterium TaxID=2635961 RepID=UPI0015C0D6B5|nr:MULTISPECIES: regulatory protein RecX [unclassified Sediminibacterium]MBW0160782.1 RecX family transcriptional regulator [Sediminibacterium sp.]MBW0165076.1 RecX family transcriptional regulator [Sediminibacterium sp.]NWK64530.1 RecX family transcriptional regulator [Sediminibacterium sp. Gen4]
MFSKRLTPEQAWQKIKHFCAYQERCHFETKEKLFGFGLSKTDVETLISRLIEEDYLNEARFAAQFAGGHFRIKKWGRVKIVYALKQKRVSPVNIKSALKEIDEENYKAILMKLAEAKWKLLKHEQYLNRQAKTSQYLMNKGYEPTLVQETIQQIRRAAKD